jgi:hypothetical protein
LQDLLDLVRDRAEGWSEPARELVQKLVDFASDGLDSLPDCLPDALNRPPLITADDWLA